jgi:hypothetical protein
MSKVYFFFAITATFLLTSCGIAITTGGNSSGASTKSKIVQQVEDAGSGPLDKVSKEALYEWFQNRQELVLKVNKQCKEIRPTAPAGWGDTPEGRVCEVVKSHAAFSGQ